MRQVPLFFNRTLIYIKRKLKLLTFKMYYDMTSFEKDINKGNYGEQLYMDWLDSKGVVYEDVSSDAEYRKLGIDFIITCKNNEKIYTDVKNNWKGGDIIIEVHSNILNDDIKLGWFFTSKANYINFIDPKNMKMVTLQLNIQSKNHILANCIPATAIQGATGSLNLEYNKISYNKKGSNWQSTFMRIPMHMIKDYITIQDLKPKQLDETVKPKLLF